MESKTENETNPLNTSEEIRKKAREELNRQLEGLLNNKPIEKLTDDNIEDEVNRLMEEVDSYEKNYIPKDIDENAFNDLKKFEEEFGQEDFDEEEKEEEFEEDEKEESNNIKKTNNIIKEKNNEIIETTQKKNKKNKIEKKEKKTNFDLDLEIEDLEDIIEKDYNTGTGTNRTKKNKSDKNNIMQDKEIKDLLNEYEKQLNIEVEREVEKEYKPKIDPNDIKRADILLKKDPLINEAIVQGMITREELILFIDYYEIFSLSNKAKKFTSEHLKALDDLCLKSKKNEKNENLDQNQNQKKHTFDLNDEDAISKLTSEIEKKLESSEDILNKKLDYEKLMMSKNNNNTGTNINNKDNLKNILEKYKKDNNININSGADRNIISSKSNKSNISNLTNKSGFTNNTNYTNIDNNKKDEINFNTKVNNIKSNINIEEKGLTTNNSEISSFNFTTEELMSVPKYTIYKNKKEKDKKEINNNSNPSVKITKINNNTFYKNNPSNNNTENENESFKPKTPLKPLSKDKTKINKNNITNNTSVNSSLSINPGKKTIPPIKNKNSNNNLKSKTNQRFDLFDDDGNPLNMGKFKGARKELVKLKMGGKSKMHELFTNKPRNMEENEKLRQKFMDFIQTGRENNKNYDPNALKKSIVRKKIEDAQKFNKYKK